MVTQRMVHIREAMEKDLSTVLSIEYKCFKDPYPLSLLNRLLIMHPDGFLVAEVDGKVVGYVIGVIKWRATGHILAIGVDPMYRRQYIGSALMEQMINRLKEKGAKLVRLETRKSNIDAQRFYLKLGFKMVGEIPYYYEDGETAIAMERSVEN
ncbi:MAG TPA: ribosomal-protein-alanine N-acetyltransferase [Hadesarchaea archaeon]|nr:ribosomal-protein-alanine N-acetyltransferase [Hadesarchaea archaeon]